MKFYRDQLKSVGENEADRFSFAQTLWFPGKVNQWKWYEMVEVNGAYKHGR